MMGSQAQLSNEFYSTDNDSFDVFDAPDYYTSDEQLVLIAVLLLLEQRYRLLRGMSSDKLVNEIDNIVSSFKKELNDTALNKLENYLYNEFKSELDSWSIPVTGYVTFSTEIKKILSQSITNLCNQLRDELKLKAKYHNMGLTDDIIDVKPNFRRASQKLKDAMGDALIKGKEMNHRQILEFVYGTSKLYRWLTMNDSKVCDWCRYQESLPPRPLSEIPYDHNRGRCGLDPIDTSYSDEYYLLLARNIL